MAAFIGSISVLFRQTNIIWVVFVAGLAASKSLMNRIQPEKKDISPESQQSFTFLWTVLQQLLKWITKDRKSLLNFLIDVVSAIWPYILVGIGFVTFVVMNGSIVLGAKNDHQAILHFPQIFYCISFCVAFSFMYHMSWSHIKSFTRFLYNKPLIVVAFCVISTLLVWKFTFAHRYLLADNRHYSFYVWAKIYRRHDLIKYALIPCYLFAMWSMFKVLEYKNILWKCVYCTCVGANLIPSPLLEFRYFIIPYLIYRLNMPLGSYTKLSIELLLYLLVNSATLYLFIEKPFQWENTSGYQRFMW
jgi:alpha-1,2-glucosyltransferase